MESGTLLLLAGYIVVILMASLVGGWLPMMVTLTHRRVEFAISFISGMMLGIGLLHLLPHALMEIDVTDAHGAVGTIMLWFIAGLLLMFFLERFFCYHHHDAPGDDEHDHDHSQRADHDHAHDHSITWAGALIGLTIHSIIGGIALAASVEADRHGATGIGWWGVGTFLVIALHKPFDALTILTLMRVREKTTLKCHLVNVAFSLAIPVGVILFYLGMSGSGSAGHGYIAAALAFSAGTFVCIALSDLLPELKFHNHDRYALSASLLIGLALAFGIAKMEASTHDHSHHGHDHAGHDHAGHDH
ncbi:MAG: ZIP family metal transporter [Planctomycetota bacterium]